METEVSLTIVLERGAPIVEVNAPTYMDKLAIAAAMRALLNRLEREISKEFGGGEDSLTAA